jgi:hypothetical protein
MKVHVKNLPLCRRTGEAPTATYVAAKDAGFSYYNSRKSTDVLPAKMRRMTDWHQLSCLCTITAA